MSHRIGLWWVLPMLAVGAVRAEGQASGMEPLAQGPRFLLASASSAQPVRVDAARMPALRQHISVAFDGVPLRTALTDIAAKSGLRLEYSDAVVPLKRTVDLTADDITVAAALTVVLLDAGVDVMLEPGGRAMLVRRSHQAGERQVEPGTIFGRVTDAKTGDALSGAEVFLEGTRWRAGTADDGSYRLAEVTPGSYTLVARRIGYGRERQAVTVGDGEEVTVDVGLQPVPTQLDELVTTVTGEQRRRELGHVVGRINADSLVKEAPVSNVTELLTARIPGLLVQPMQGTVGGEVKLQIRSPNSTRLDTEPIVIVDGVRYTTNPRAGPGSYGIGNGYRLGPFIGSVEGTSRLNDLNPNDIESIEVVKGPSAATLYGTDAANGVIVITTKRGLPGPARWNTYGRASSSEVPTYRYPDSYWGWGTGTSSCSLQNVAQSACVQDSVTVLPNPLNDPALTIFSSKPRWEYGANVAGGRQDFRYYFSADFEDATGPVGLPPALIAEIKNQRGVSELPQELLTPNAFTKFNLRSSASVGLGQRAELRVTAGYTQSATRTLVTSYNNPLDGAGLGDPTHPFLPASSPAEAFAQTSTERVNRWFGSAVGEWRPASWLQARAMVGLDLTNSNRYSLARPGEAPNAGFGSGIVGDERSRSLASSADLGVTASLRRGRVSSRTSLGTQYVGTVFDGLTSSGRGLPPGGSSIGDAASVNTFQIYHERVTLGSYLEQTFGLNDRLFLTGALRMDGASSFGRDYNAAFYPKAGVSWIVSEEPFLPRLPGVDELRLRYAYGASGQQPWPAYALSGYAIPKYLADGTVGNAVERTYLGNPDLRPERVREHEFGLDAAALQGRVQLDLTWNSRRTLDQLNLVELAPGFGSSWMNVGRIDGHGFEAQLTLRPVDSRQVSWDVSVHHAWHSNEVVELGGGAPQRRTDTGFAEGYPVGGRFAYPLLGYSDTNGNGIIEGTEVELGDSLVYVGRSIPPRTQTLSTTLGLFQQRLRISGLLDRQSGYLLFDQRIESQCVFSRRCRAAVDPTTPLAEQAQVAAIEAAGSSLFYVPMESGDFTRLREVTVALDLPDGLVRALRLREASLSLSARNLALWTSYRGADPESFAIPQARAWAVRFDIGF
jgi:TonB-linked SusC/RagA family outer membrane protein